MTTTVVKTAFIPATAGVSFIPSTEEEAIQAIPSLRGWFEADSGIEAANGFRWRDRLSTRKATVLNSAPPLVVTGSHGRPAIQTSYGSVKFTGTERGAMRPPSEYALIGTSAFTVYSVTRVPTVASGESATLGGYVWSSRGPAGNNTPGLNISGSTGDPVFRAGGAVMSNPGALDLRDGLWHLVRCTWTGSSITVAVDRNRQVTSASGATTAPDSTVANMLAPSFGCFINSATEGVTTPFYGQTSALLFFDAVPSSTERAAVEDYLAAKYGVTLV
jgi:hypothetical protein